MKKYCAYIDESGDPNFNPGASPLFFICATIIKEEDTNSIGQRIAEIKKSNDLHEFKSSKLSSDIRRTEILEQISKLPVSFFTILVEKNNLNGDWFRYRKSFYKYIQRCLVSELYRVYGNLDVILDQYGSIQYQESFKSYLEVNLQLEMFSSQIDIGSAKTNSLIQISDIVGGSIRKYYAGEYDIAESILSSCWKGKLKIPSTSTHQALIESSKYEDKEIANLSLEATNRYLSANKSNTDKITHCLVVEYLKQMSLEEPDRFCFRSEIITWLKFNGLELSEENLSRTIISELRDEGVFLASTNEGIKIPTSFSEIIEHYDFILGQAMPSLRRLKIIDQVLSIRIPEKHKELMGKYEADVENVIAKLHS